MGQLVRAVAASRKSTELFKSLAKVTVSANPYDQKATTAREFLRRVSTQPVKKANPKMRVDYDLIEDYGNPQIKLQYDDGFEQVIRANGLLISDILDEVEKVARWKGDGAKNPFGDLRKARAKQLGL